MCYVASMRLNLVLRVPAPVAAGLTQALQCTKQDFGSLCARILAAGQDDIVRFSPGTQRDMQSRLWEAGLSFSNAERVELTLHCLGVSAAPTALVDSLDSFHRFRFPPRNAHRF